MEAEKRSLFSLCADLDSVDVDDLTQKLTHFTSKIKERQKRKPKTPRQIAQGDSEVDECKSSAADKSQLDDDGDKATAFAESENQMKLARSSARRVRDVCDEGEVEAGDRPGTPRSRATKGKDRAQIEKSNTKAADRQSRDVIRSSPAGTVRWVE